MAKKKVNKRQVKKAVKAAKKHPVAAIIIVILILIILGVGAALYFNGFFDKFLMPNTTTTQTQTITTLTNTTNHNSSTTKGHSVDFNSLNYTDNVLSSPTLDSLTPEVKEDGYVEDVIYQDFQIHFMENGVYNTGDATYIKAGDTDILIDAGAIGASALTLIDYIDQYCTDGILEYVITTHAHTDHWAGMYGNSQKNSKASVAFPEGTTRDKTGIMYYYKIGTIIDFAQSEKEIDRTKDTEYTKYLDAVDFAVSQGATHYTAVQCFENADGAQREYVLDETLEITMSIVYNKYYFEKSNDENNHSVCTLFTFGEHNYLLTGDLEQKGEEELAKYYDGSTPEKTLPEVDLFKAGHHGSGTSSNDCLLSKINPKICCVCCCAGSDEYTVDLDNIFPTQAFVNRISKYTDRVYVTTYLKEAETKATQAFQFASLNGSICVSSNGKYVGLYATNNLVKLKDSEWFNETVYVNANNSVASGSKKSKNYYTEPDEGLIEKKRRIWPTA